MTVIELLANKKLYLKQINETTSKIQQETNDFLCTKQRMKL